MDFLLRKRERTRNFTGAEKKLLQDIVQQHLEAVEDKSSKFTIGSGLGDSEADHSYRSDPLLADIDSSRAGQESARRATNCHRNNTPGYTLEEVTCAEDILWRRLELRCKKEVHDHKLMAMKAMLEQELRAKQETHEQDLLLRREEHEFEKNMKQKLLELETANRTKRNALLDLEIALKARQLNK